jgi:hypothetical protein
MLKLPPKESNKETRKNSTENRSKKLRKVWHKLAELNLSSVLNLTILLGLLKKEAIKEGEIQANQATKAENIAAKAAIAIQIKSGKN